MTDAEKRAQEYWKGDLLTPMNNQIDEMIKGEETFTIYADNYKADVLGAFRDGYEKGQADLIVKLADFLHVSLTFRNPVEVAKKLMEKK